LARSEPSALRLLPGVLALIFQRPVTDRILDTAGQLPGASLRSLDAIHLATAEDLSHVLTSFVAYDKRLAEAARSRGLATVAPS
jgi:predicted nucleic acid-binding protein